MKMLTLLTFCFVSLSASASDSTWNKSVLKTLNGLCGDVWCEGDYSIDFRRFNCNFNKAVCVVKFTMQEHGEGRHAKMKRTCVLSGYDNEESVTKPDPIAYDENISNRFYEELSDCINAHTDIRSCNRSALNRERQKLSDKYRAEKNVGILSANDELDLQAGLKDLEKMQAIACGWAH